MKKTSKMTMLLTLIVLLCALMLSTTTNLSKGIKLGLDLKGGFEILYQASPVEDGKPVTHDSLVQTANSLVERIGKLTGYVAEPEVTVEGSDHIRVRLAGINNPDEVRQILSKPAELSFRGPDGSKEMLGSDFVENAATVQYNKKSTHPYITIQVKDPEKFKDVTTRLQGKPLAIYLDDQQLAAPEIHSVITNGQAVIEGLPSFDKVKSVADTINLGALPLKLSEKYMQKVDPTLGQLSFHKTVIFGLIATAIILLFMALIYRAPGLVANLSILLYIWLLLLIFYLMHATLTLPGIAAFVLGIGMAVDANIIIFERIKDELRSGKSVASAIKAGSRNSLRTIIDANLTTVIAGAVLYALGNGAVKGFALTLIFSIGVSILSNVLFSRFILQQLVALGLLADPKRFGYRGESAPKAGRWSIDIVKHRRKFFALSAAITVLGAVIMASMGLRLGVDFKSGTNLDVALGTSATQVQVERVLKDAGVKQPAVIQIGEGGHTVIRFGEELNVQEADAVKASLTKTYGEQIAFEENKVSPDMARELGVNAMIAVLVACAAIVVYVTIRFEWRFALAAIAALLHDVFIVVSLFSILRLEIDLPFIAAILTIIGYSINDTIVIFDRIRENEQAAKIKTFGELEALVNRSIGQTMTRSVYTVATVFIAAFCLLFGGEPIRLFSLAMIFGLVSGAYSSIFIASPLWLLMKKKGKAARSRASATQTAG